MKGQIIKISTGEEYLILDEKKINLKTYLLANKLDEKERMTDTFSFFSLSVLKDNYLKRVTDPEELAMIQKKFAEGNPSSDTVKEG